MTQPKDFAWSDSDEPHATRRRAILAKYPEIRSLFTKEPRTALFVVLILIAQLFVAKWAQTASLGWILVVAYVFGGTVNHTLQLAVHELSHNLCWESLIANKLTAILANFPTGVPSAIVFQKYHMEHHQFQGVDGVDTDIPTTQEVSIFTNSLLKLFWLVLQPFFYAFRPLMVKPKQPGFWEGVNGLSVLAFDVAVYCTIGGWGLFYLITGSLLGLGLHPAAGHFVAEHYTLTPGQETYSYYGPCNFVNFNVGYHNEHHDFPKVPWSNLPKVSKMAPEFYSSLPSYTSYIYVLYRYVIDPNVGPFSRIKRKAPLARNNPQLNPSTDDIVVVEKADFIKQE
jgi:sphingolipid delta-4 desaturase